MQRRAATIWGSALGGLLAYDILCDRRHDNSTLSCVTRSAVAATPGGPYVFTAALVGGCWWFRGHVLGPLAHAIDNT